MRRVATVDRAYGRRAFLAVFQGGGIPSGRIRLAFDGVSGIDPAADRAGDVILCDRIPTNSHELPIWTANGSFLAFHAGMPIGNSWAKQLTFFPLRSTPLLGPVLSW